jgi:hypothetical protein
VDRGGEARMEKTDIQNFDVARSSPRSATTARINASSQDRS